MEKKLIFIPFAFDSNKETGANMKRCGNAFDVYCKNLCVALISFARENPDCDTALVTNAALPSPYAELLSGHHVQMFEVPYDTFVFEDGYTWSLAFYKLCALLAVTKYYEYDYYCYTDADVICNHSLTHVWTECRDRILLYDINHGLGVRDYTLFVEQTRQFLSEDCCLTHYGGEFFAANRANAAHFAEVCLQVYEEMAARNFRTTMGDEFIVSLAAHRLGMRIKNAGAYIYRFWTGTFRLVSTCYHSNAVAVLHLPAEKSNGMVKIFDRYLVRNRFPDRKQIYSLCHLQKQDPVLALKALLRRIGS